MLLLEELVKQHRGVYIWTLHIDFYFIYQETFPHLYTIVYKNTALRNPMLSNVIKAKYNSKK